MNSPRTFDHAVPAEFAGDTKPAHHNGPLARLCYHAGQQAKGL